MTGLFFLSWRNLFRNPRRTAASLATVGLGAAGLLIYQGFNEGIMNQYRENVIRVRYGHGQLFPKGYRDRAHGNPREEWIKDPDTVETVLLSIPEVKQVFARASFYSFLTKGPVRMAAKGEGVQWKKEPAFFTSMNFEAGGDLSGPGQIILGRGLANSLGAKPGDKIRLMSQTVEGDINDVGVVVAGIFHTGAQDFDSGVFRVDIETAQELLKTKRVELFTLRNTGIEAWPAVVKAVGEKLPDLEAVPYDELDKVYYKNAVAFLNAQFAFIRVIMLFIVALGIFNTITVGMLERAPEIGALRANGEPRRRLFGVLMRENALLGVLGGALGIGLAVLMDQTILSRGIPMPPGPGITRHFLIFLEIQPSHFVQAMLLPMLATVLSGLWPVTRLLRQGIPALLRP
ncbi:MAG: ABC transporter permease [Elusimicrobia bacterium]|nr:ABC transporter permease [Elusimicrobiota bacterium]